MRKELVGRTIGGVEVLQPKCVNLPAEEFQAALTGAEIRDVAPRDKWLQVETTRGWLLLNLGMGGEILLTDREHLPEKLRLVLDLDDGTCLAINFWWVGHAHYAADLAAHAMTAKLGPNALDLTLAQFRALLRGRRGAIKYFLLTHSPSAASLASASASRLRSRGTCTNSTMPSAATAALAWACNWRSVGLRTANHPSIWLTTTRLSMRTST
jgi:formamidopyrimidine-DNA glycosylase